ncbi:cyclopropane-fatty-acyl-phospholipid synthase family protein [Oceanicaulis sp. MMSF_3324]|uniref:SAM-dependent methyltransferase n=1 Tax=Oceanicaulis sp. MMSF_3324 TaxID=3046702 RepID=UPI00273DF235|nr:cyclopropane-fatty-acyl-phospholipid synthase family protein [Oceanicaulis sp. MMSF_3324]
MTDFAADPLVRADSSAVIDRLKGVPRGVRLTLRMLLKLKVGTLTVRLPDGRAVQFEGRRSGPDAVMELNNYSVVRKVISGGDVGFAESYMDGDWTTPDLAAVLTVFSANLDEMAHITRGGPITRFFHWLYHLSRANTKSQARKNIEAHYDLGNDFYELWLDETMTYSSARFTDGVTALKDAQSQKYAALARSIDLQPDHHVLEIGCGWGGFAEYAAGEVGAHVTCLTLSPAQRDYAIARMERLGLSDKVDIKLQDYRDETGTYDRVASIEMFEAVGQEFWPSFFTKVSDVLKPGGKAGLQIITIRDDLFETYSKRADFIQRYIFPGGMMPSVEKLEECFSSANLDLEKTDQFGLDYADTLKVWKERFNEAWPRIKPMGFDERFKCMWDFYLAYCEAGFRTGRIDVGQFTVSRA